MTALFAGLKDRTALDHARLERQLDLMSDSLTPGRYQRVLQAFHGFMLAYERQLQRGAPTALAELVAERLRSQLLHQDLLALGLDERAIAALPQPRELPAMDSLPALLGCMYVMEGSTLGGRVIGPQLERRLGLRDGRGYSYFLGHGAATGRLWTAFRTRMEQELVAEQHDAAIAAAGTCFRSLSRWFAAIEPERRAAA